MLCVDNGGYPILLLKLLPDCWYLKIRVRFRVQILWKKSVWKKSNRCRNQKSKVIKNQRSFFKDQKIKRIKSNQNWQLQVHKKSKVQRSAKILNLVPKVVSMLSMQRISSNIFAWASLDPTQWPSMELLHYPSVLPLEIQMTSKFINDYFSRITDLNKK